MKSENEIRLVINAMQKNIDALWENKKIHTALEEEIKLDVLKWVLDEPRE